MNFAKFKENTEELVKMYEKDGNALHYIEAAQRCFAVQDIFDEQYETVFAQEERDYMSSIVQRSTIAMLDDIAKMIHEKSTKTSSKLPDWSTPVVLHEGSRLLRNYQPIVQWRKNYEH